MFSKSHTSPQFFILHHLGGTGGNISEERITEDDVQRITEDGEVRVTEGV